MTSWRTNVGPRWLAGLAALLPWCLNILTPSPDDGRTMFRVYDILLRYYVQYLTYKKDIMLVAVSNIRCRAHIHQSPCFFSRATVYHPRCLDQGWYCLYSTLRDSEITTVIGPEYGRIGSTAAECLRPQPKKLQSPFKIKPLHDSVLTFGSIAIPIVGARTRKGAQNVTSMYI